MSGYNRGDVVLVDPNIVHIYDMDPAGDTATASWSLSGHSTLCPYGFELGVTVCNLGNL